MGALHQMKSFAFAIVILGLALFVDAKNHAEDSILIEATASISDLKKKGATEADCKDLAKTTCKEVEKERSNMQKVIDGLKSGRECLNLGQNGIRKATVHWQKTKKTHTHWKTKVTQALNYKVSFASKSFSSLKSGKCSFIFTSRSYLSAKAKASHAVRVEISWRARVSEAWKMVLRMRMIAKIMVKKCQCATKKAYYQVWKNVTERKRLARQSKAYAKCKMMTCVLKGTKLSSAQCKGKLPSLKRKKLDSATAKAKCATKQKGSTLVSNALYLGNRRGKMSHSNFKTKKEFTLSMDIKPKRKVRGWGSILHVTSKTNQERIPALFFFPGQTRLHIRVSRLGAANSGCDPSLHLPINRWTQVKIVVAGHFFKVFYNGRLVCSKGNYYKKWPAKSRMKVYTADPWHTAAHAWIRNVRYF